LDIFSFRGGGTASPGKSMNGISKLAPSFRNLLVRNFRRQTGGGKTFSACA